VRGTASLRAGAVKLPAGWLRKRTLPGSGRGGGGRASIKARYRSESCSLRLCWLPTVPATASMLPILKRFHATSFLGHGISRTPLGVLGWRGPLGRPGGSGVRRRAADSDGRRAMRVTAGRQEPLPGLAARTGEQTCAPRPRPHAPRASPGLSRRRRTSLRASPDARSGTLQSALGSSVSSTPYLAGPGRPWPGRLTA
jgi:hypothetical protein